MLRCLAILEFESKPPRFESKVEALTDLLKTMCDRTAAQEALYVARTTKVHAAMHLALAPLPQHLANSIVDRAHEVEGINVECIECIDKVLAAHLQRAIDAEVRVFLTFDAETMGDRFVAWMEQENYVMNRMYMCDALHLHKGLANATWSTVSRGRVVEVVSVELYGKTWFAAFHDLRDDIDMPVFIEESVAFIATYRPLVDDRIRVT